MELSSKKIYLGESQREKGTFYIFSWGETDYGILVHVVVVGNKIYKNEEWGYIDWIEKTSILEVPSVQEALEFLSPNVV